MPPGALVALLPAPGYVLETSCAGVFAKAKHILLPKDYIRYKLTGVYAMDKADGAGTVNKLAC